MYGIVADVERYPEFVPWCAGLRVESREKSENGEILIAETIVGFKSLRERYTSRVTLNPAARTVDVLQTKGVFRHLENHWKFIPEGQGCRIDFKIAFEFRSRILGIVADAALGQVLLRMTDAFEKRAKALSKKPS
jgi:coenzyme Q-binding protein COQ10